MSPKTNPTLRNGLSMRSANTPQPTSKTTSSFNKQTPQAMKTIKAKKIKSPFELEYEQSLSQLRLLQEKLEHQTLAASQLERNALEYYYTNDICFENYEGEHVPQETSGLHYYYFASVISKAKRERRERRECEDAQLQDELRRVQMLEEDVHENIIKGFLATEQGLVDDIAKETDILRQHLFAKLEEETRCSDSLFAEEQRQETLRKEQQESEKRRQLLESGRKQQMEDVETTRLLLAKQREEFAAAEKELKKREAVVNDLNEKIRRLTQKRRQRE